MLQKYLTISGEVETDDWVPGIYSVPSQLSGHLIVYTQPIRGQYPVHVISLDQSDPLDSLYIQAGVEEGIKDQGLSPGVSMSAIRDQEMKKRTTNQKLLLATTEESGTRHLTPQPSLLLVTESAKQQNCS